MKKKNVLNLIKYYTEKNDPAFRNEAYEIARYFDAVGNPQLAEHIMAMLSDSTSFVPQTIEFSSSFLKKIDTLSDALPLPQLIANDIIGLVNAITKDIGINKFLFQGLPGTGKTESAKQVARLSNRELFSVEFESIIDSKLGQTSKNIAKLFDEISNFSQPQKIIILFDEIDALAVDRINKNDMREMGRATSAILKGFDNLNEKIVLIATTNLFEFFDKALSRRFDFIIDFNRYNREDLISISESILNNYLGSYKIQGRNMKLFKKIVELMDNIPYPGELKNIIRSSLAFSDTNIEFDYLKRFMVNIGKSELTKDIKQLKKNNFTVRDIEVLTGISKSQVSRELVEA